MAIKKLNQREILYLQNLLKRREFAKKRKEYGFFGTPFGKQNYARAACRS